MQKHLATYFRLIAVSVVALGLAACAPLASPTGFAALRPEPRVGDAPGAGALPQHPASAAEADRLAQLEGQVEALAGGLANLRLALDVMGPLPSHPEIFIPVSLSEIHDEPADISKLYAAAPALPNGASLFQQAQPAIVGVQHQPAAWEPSAAANLNTALAAGPLAVDADVDALCVELAAIAGPCHGLAPLRAY